MVRDVAGNHGACSDKAVFPYGGSAHDGAVGAESGAMLDQGEGMGDVGSFVSLSRRSKFFFFEPRLNNSNNGFTG